MSANSVHRATEVPSRSLPVPDTTSPQMQAVIARPFDMKFAIAPTTHAEWKARVSEATKITEALLPELREKLGVPRSTAT